MRHKPASLPGRSGYNALYCYPLIGKFLLELSPDIGSVPLAVMKIAGLLGQIPSALRKLLQREVKELVVIRLKPDLTGRLKQHLVFIQEIPVSQASLGLSPASPGIAEIDIDTVNFAIIEKVLQQLGVSINEEKIGNLQGVGLFDSGKDH